jgi:hypothetical protein
MRGDQLSRQWRVIRAIEASLLAFPPELFCALPAFNTKTGKEKFLASLASWREIFCLEKNVVILTTIVVILATTGHEQNN